MTSKILMITKCRGFNLKISFCDNIDGAIFRLGQDANQTILMRYSAHSDPTFFQQKGGVMVGLRWGHYITGCNKTAGSNPVSKVLIKS